ncbi:hypothetical protein Tco_1232328, partial [Tanacetum coccineum]
FDMDALNGEEVFVARKNENVVEEVVDAAQVSTTATTVTITTEEITLAPALEALKTSKPKGKGIMIEEPMKPMKKKVQIMLDEKTALKLQAEFDEEERLQKVEDDKETTERKQCLEIIPDEEEVTIDVIPLAVKSPRIVDWKIHNFDMEDLEDLYKLVKARYGSTRPVESMDYLLWNDMKIITFLEDAVYADLHAGIKEISSYTTYNYRYAEQEASVNVVEGVNAASEEVSTVEL